MLKSKSFLTLWMILTCLGFLITPWSLEAQGLTLRSGTQALMLTPSPTVVGTPLASAASKVNLTVKVKPNPPVQNEEVEISLILNAVPVSAASCVGIPDRPFDGYLVVDNSFSAGVGPGSNIELTRQWLIHLIDQVEMVDFPFSAGVTAQKIRLGLVATRLTPQGSEMFFESLSEDYVNLRKTLEAISAGGDTELAPGIRQAVLSLEQRGRPHVRHALIFVLHDQVPLTDPETISAIEEARQHGVELYFIINTLNINAERVAQPEAWTDPTHIWYDPPAQKFREILLSMTGISQALARDILVAGTWSNGLQALDSFSTTTDNLVSWYVEKLDGKASETFTYRAIIPESKETSGSLEFNVMMTYRDCNGEGAIALDSFLFQVVPGSGLELTLSPSKTPGVYVSPTPPAPTPVSLDNGEKKQGTGPIPSLIELIKRIAPTFAGLFAPLEILSSALQWLFLLILLALILIALFWLIKKLLKWFRRSTSNPSHPSPPEPPPPPKPVQDVSIPKWLEKLPETTLVPRSIQFQSEGDDIQDTLILGIGPAGREVIAQLVKLLRGRFGSEWLKNRVRLIQIDVKIGDENSSPPDGLPTEYWVVLRPDITQIERNLQEAPENWPHLAWYTKTGPDYPRSRGRLAFFDDVKSGRQGSRLWKVIENGLQGLNNPYVYVVGTTFDDESSGMLIDVLRLIRIVHSGVIPKLWLMGPLGCDWALRLGRPGQVRVNEQEKRTLATLRELERFQRNARVRYRYLSNSRIQQELDCWYAFALVSEVLVFEPKNFGAKSGAPEDDVLPGMADALYALLNREAAREWDQHIKRLSNDQSRLANSKGKGAVLTIGCYAVRLPVVWMHEALIWRIVREALFEAASGMVPIEKQNPDGTYSEFQGFGVSGPKHEEIVKFVDNYHGNFSSKAFREAVRKKVNNFLNGEQDASQEVNPTLARRQGIERAQQWVSRVRQELLRRQEVNAAASLKQLADELERWLNWFKEDLYPLCKTRHDEAQRELKRLQQQTGRSWGLTDDLEWPFYRQYLRSWTETPVGTWHDEPLLRVACRFGWDVECVPYGWRVRFLIPDGEFGEKITPQTVGWLRPYEYVISGINSSKILERLRKLAERVVPVEMSERVVDLALRQDAQEWLKNAAVTSRLRYDSISAARTFAQDTLHLLLAPSERRAELAARLLAQPNRPIQLRTCESKDATSVILMEASNWIPLSTLMMYSEERWMRMVVSPSYYTWEAEQKAAELESGGRFSARFVSFIAENEALLKAFGLAWIYQCITLTDRGWRIPGLQEAVDGNLDQALSKLFELDDVGNTQLEEVQLRRLRGLYEEVERQRSSLSQRNIYLREVKSRIRDLSRQGVVSEDLAAYLDYLVEQER